MLPKISIVTPTFNQGRFIEETILSVLDQGYPNLEYIIIDGGSSDQTVDIIRKYAKHLKYWVSEPDSGQSEAINKGLVHASGDLFNWLNSDDKLAPNSLLNVADALADNVDIISGREIYFSKTKNEKRYGTIVYDTLEETIFESVIYQPSTFWRLDILRKFLPIKENLHFLMDADLWMRYLMHCGASHIVKMDQTLAYFRMHDAAKTSKYSDDFVKERWQLRGAFLQDSKIADWLIPLVPFENGSIGFGEYKPDIELSEQIMVRLFSEALLEYYYVAKDYDKLKEVLQILLEHRISSSRIAGYRTRMRMPRWILDMLRPSMHA